MTGITWVESPAEVHTADFDPGCPLLCFLLPDPAKTCETIISC